MNKKLASAMMFLVMTAALLLSSPAAHADSFKVTLDTPSQAVALGGTASFYGEITADAGNAADVNLGGDTINLDPSLTTDDSAYLNGAPFTLAPGEVYSGLLFTVTAGAVPGDFNGSFMVDGSDVAGLDIPSTAFFNINAVPEPASVLLLATGAAGMLGAFRRRMK